METIIQILAQELGQSEAHVQNVVTLLDEGNTIPFIARYRKELHGSMDDTALRTLEERLQYLRNLEKRREEVKGAIESQGKLTEELSAAIDNAATLAEVEDLYRPYKQKRRTRATAAREKGLEPLAALLYAQKPDCPDPLEAAAGYVDPEKGVETAEDALQGAGDIIAEDISDDAAVRKALRAFMQRRSELTASAAKEEDSVYRLYYDFRQSVNRLQGHQVLAINRGEREEFLKVGVETNRDEALILLRRAVVRPGTRAAEFIKAAAEDAYDRLLYPSLEREIRSALTDEASEGAIHNFALNLRPLLMQPPVKGHVTMGLDPGYRMGCKVAVVDGTGKVLDTTVVYPTHGERKKAECIQILAGLIRRHGVTHIAIGNGTASRETEQMTVELLRQVGGGVSYMIVSEAGASVYSASKLASEEFPEYDVNLRSAVSIARRLQDPLAELVKIDPKAIGVGQSPSWGPRHLSSAPGSCGCRRAGRPWTTPPSIRRATGRRSGCWSSPGTPWRRCPPGSWGTWMDRSGPPGRKTWRSSAAWACPPCWTWPRSCKNRAATPGTSCPRPCCGRTCWKSRTCSRGWSLRERCATSLTSACSWISGSTRTGWCISPRSPKGSF